LNVFEKFESGGIWKSPEFTLHAGHYRKIFNDEDPPLLKFRRNLRQGQFAQ
jgi:hypothetical protein